jgi:hypothetical protein
MVSEPSRCRKVVSSEPKTETGEPIEIEFTQSIQRNRVNLLRLSLRFLMIDNSYHSCPENSSEGPFDS